MGTVRFFFEGFVKHGKRCICDGTWHCSGQACSRFFKLRTKENKQSKRQQTATTTTRTSTSPSSSITKHTPQTKRTLQANKQFKSITLPKEPSVKDGDLFTEVWV